MTARSPLPATITNDVNLTLDGTGHQLTISGNGAPAFIVNTNVSFTVLNLSVADTTSLGGSAILNLGGTVSLIGVSFRWNTSTLYIPGVGWNLRPGGGAILEFRRDLNRQNCSFVGNTAQTMPINNFIPAQASGGAIRNDAGQVQCRACTFVGNRASGGAGVSRLGELATRAVEALLTIAGRCWWTFIPSRATRQQAVPVQGRRLFRAEAAPGGEGSGGAIFNQGTLAVDRTMLCVTLEQVATAAQVDMAQLTPPH